MAHIDPKARKDRRYRVNLNHYQSAAIEALAALHRKQSATYLAEIIEAHLETLNTENHTDNVSRCA